MKTSDTYRLIIFTLCCISFLGTAIIASAEERYKGKIIKLWPKDVASQDTKGMGTMKPGRSEGSLRLTDITQPYLSYFPAPAGKKPRPVVIVSPFLNANWNSGVVTIQFGDKKSVLDFNKNQK